MQLLNVFASENRDFFCEREQGWLVRFIYSVLCVREGGIYIDDYLVYHNSNSTRQVGELEAQNFQTAQFQTVKSMSPYADTRLLECPAFSIRFATFSIVDDKCSGRQMLAVSPYNITTIMPTLLCSGSLLGTSSSNL